MILNYTMTLKKRKLLILTLIVLVSSGCFQLFDPGPSTVVLTVFNPAKNQQAILFLKGGNATSGDSMQVSIKDGDEVLGDTEVGNVLTVDNAHVGVALDTNAIKLKWLDNNKLEIDYNKKLRTFIKVDKYNNNLILYKTF